MNDSGDAGQVARDAVVVARISMTQAIAVAVVTAVGGFVTAYITRPATPTPPAAMQQHWLTIERVSHTGSGMERYRRVRVTAEVNGTNYSFPTNTLWATIGSGMAGEKFPLPTGADTYQIKFFAFAEDDNSEVIGLANRHAEEIPTQKLPLSGLAQGIRYTSLVSNESDAGMQVHYSLQ